MAKGVVDEFIISGNSLVSKMSTNVFYYFATMSCSQKTSVYFPVLTQIPLSVKEHPANTVKLFNQIYTIVIIIIIIQTDSLSKCYSILSHILPPDNNDSPKVAIVLASSSLKPIWHSPFSKAFCKIVCA